LAGMLEDALSKSSAELAEQLKSARLRNRSRNRRQQQNRRANQQPRENRPPSSLNKFNERLESFSQNANQFTNKITRPGVEPPQAAAAPDVDLSLPSAGSWQASLMLLLIVGCLAGVAYAVYRLSQRSLAISQRAAAVRLPAELATRADIVRVFHALTGVTLAAGNRWWTHRRAGQALAEASPQARPALEALTNVYEEARYLPADEPLSSDQLARAREALALFFAGKPNSQVCPER